MANVKDRIDRISQYFVSMKVEELDEGNQVIFISVKFPTRWFILDDLEEKYGIVVERSKDDKNIYYFGGALEDGFDNVFDAIDENINMMELAEERTRLLDEKIKALKSLFDDAGNTVEMLRSLDFTFKKPTTRSRSKTKSNNNEVEETEN